MVAVAGKSFTCAVSTHVVSAEGLSWAWFKPVIESMAVSPLQTAVSERDNVMGSGLATDILNELL